MNTDIDYNVPDQVHNIEALELCSKLKDASIDAIICDLPYGLTANKWDTVIPLDAMWAEFKRVIKPRGAIVLTAAQPFTSQLVMSNPKWYRSCWVWDKGLANGFQMANIRQLVRHEDVLVFGYPSVNYYPQKTKDSNNKYSGRTSTPTTNLRPGLIPKRSPDSVGFKFPTSIIAISKTKVQQDTGGYIHPTQKPVELMAYLVRTYTREGDVVLDPTCGSGTTAVACRNTGRHFIVGDISEEYVKIVKDRLDRTNPMSNTPLENGMTQKSLFSF